MMQLDGDLIKECEPVIGYLHRDEKQKIHQSVYSLYR